MIGQTMKGMVLKHLFEIINTLRFLGSFWLPPCRKIRARWTASVAAAATPRCGQLNMPALRQTTWRTSCRVPKAELEPKGSSPEMACSLKLNQDSHAAPVLDSCGVQLHAQRECVLNASTRPSLVESRCQASFIKYLAFQLILSHRYTNSGM